MRSNHFFKLNKVGSQITLTFAVIVAFYILNIVYNLSAINMLDSSVSQIYNDRMLSIASLLEADRDSYQSTLALSHSLLQRDHDTTKVSLERLYGEVESNLLQVKERFDRFKSVHQQSGGDEHPAFEVFAESYEEVVKITQNLLSLHKSGRNTEMQSIYFTDYKTQFDQMRDAMDQLTGVSYDLAKANFEVNQAKSFDISRNALFFFIVIAFHAIYSCNQSRV